MAETAKSAEATLAAAERAREVAAGAARAALAASGDANLDLDKANADLAEAEERMRGARTAYQQEADRRRDRT